MAMDELPWRRDYPSSVAVEVIHQPADLHPPVTLNSPQEVAPYTTRGHTAACEVWTRQKETCFSRRLTWSWDRHPEREKSLHLEVSSSAKEGGGWLALPL